MKRNQLFLALTSVCLLFSLPIACQHQTAEPPAQDKKLVIEKPHPKISFQKTVHDFGEVGIKEKGQCQFKFKNTGTALLKIGEITASCGCTVPTLSKKEYQPGEV